MLTIEDTPVWLPPPPFATPVWQPPPPFATRVYVAGSSHETVRVREAIEAVHRHRGLLLTHDWLSEIEECPVPDSQLTRVARAGYAQADLLGVENADVFWFLAPMKGVTSRGACLETGFALARRKRIVITRGQEAGTPGMPTLFEALADVEDLYDFNGPSLCAGWA